MLSRADSQVGLSSSTWSGRHTSIRAILSEEQRHTPGGNTNAQFTIRASRIRRFCFLSFLLTQKILRKYFAVCCGRERRRPISRQRAKSFICLARSLLSIGSQYAAGKGCTFSNSALFFNHALNFHQVVAQALRHNITETRASRKRIWKRHELDSGEVCQIAILIEPVHHMRSQQLSESSLVKRIAEARLHRSCTSFRTHACTSFEKNLCGTRFRAFVFERSLTTASQPIQRFKTARDVTFLVLPSTWTSTRIPRNMRRHQR